MQISVIFVKTICLQSRHIYQTLDLAVKVNFWKHSHKASGCNISDFKGHVSSCKRVLLGRSHLFYMKSFHPSSVIYISFKWKLIAFSSTLGPIHILLLNKTEKNPDILHITSNLSISVYNFS